MHSTLLRQHQQLRSFPRVAQSLILGGRCQSSKLFSPTSLRMGGHGPALRGCLAAKESEGPVSPFLSVFESPGAPGFGSRDRGGGGGGAGVSARLPATPVGGSRQQLGAPPPPARPGSGRERGCARERRAQAPPGGVSAPPGGGVVGKREGARPGEGEKEAPASNLRAGGGWLWGN